MKKIPFLFFFLPLHFLFAQLPDTSLISHYSCCIGNSIQTQPIIPTQPGCVYLWSPSIGVSDSTLAAPIITAPFSTFYERRIICGNDTSYDFAMVNVNNIPIIVWGYPDTLRVCEYQIPIKIGFDKNVAQSQLNYPFQAYTYQWNTGSTTDSITVSQSGIYRLDLLAPNSSLCDALAGEMYILVDPCTPLGVGMEERIQIFPNPASNTLNVLSSEKILSLSLWDMTGRKIFFVENCTEISVAEFAKGVYTVEIETFKGKTLKRFLLE